MEKTSISWGIIGPGIISTKFAEDIPFVERANLIAVCSRSEANARTFADKFDISKAYGDLDEMLCDPGIDAVYIGTPHPFHFEAASKAMKSGKAVLCEKPMTVYPHETRELIEIQAETGAYLMEAMWTYFLPAIQKAKSWVDTGRIGDLVAIKGDFGYPQVYDVKSRAYNPDLAGGALLDMGVYPVALAYLFSGYQSPIKTQVSARFAENGVDDDISWIFDYPDGVTATLGTSFRARFRNSAHIIGSEGYIVIPDFFRAYEAHLYQLEDCVESFKDDRSAHGFHYEIQSMTDDLLAGKTGSEVMPLSASQAFADHMDLVRQHW